ncbi:uncharacterized protein LOC135102526 [Scylla paramamosain]|uniref:uncharacterized protein LOC135102526 n=1 Tax=Scylla paramamosain TaxID=85552 RepID=UPI003083C695
MRTDHAALQWLKTVRAPEGQLARWLGLLEQYDYRMEHRPGRIHGNADCLSQRPCEPGCGHHWTIAHHNLGQPLHLCCYGLFHKVPEAYAAPNHEAETMAEILVKRLFVRFGIPDEIHSDQCREFKVQVFQECCQLLGLRKIRTTLLQSHSDGIVERFNCTLIPELAMYCTANWDHRLHTLLMAC